MEGQELKEGKQRVRDHLISPLQKSGLERKRSQKVESHLAFLDSLEARLAYMAEDRLKALAEVVERYAGGPKKNQWPAEVSIMNWARRLQIPPASQSRLVRTYLQSGAGAAAKSGGYLVELFDHLKQVGAPPTTYNMEKIRSDATHNRSRRARIRRDHENDLASPSELGWLQDYMDRRRLCLDIIEAKQKEAAA